MKSQRFEANKIRKKKIATQQACKIKKKPNQDKRLILNVRFIEENIVKKKRKRQKIHLGLGI